jgi:hypothetical protein
MIEGILNQSFLEEILEYPKTNPKIGVVSGGL